MLGFQLCGKNAVRLVPFNDCGSRRGHFLASSCRTQRFVLMVLKPNMVYVQGSHRRAFPVVRESRQQTFAW